MKILVTGGAGFIGSHLVDKLINQKHKVCVIDDLSSGKKENVNKSAKFNKLKIQDKRISSLFKKNEFDIIYHLAAQKNLQFSKDYPVKDAEINIIGSLNILSNAMRYKARKIIFYSTAAVYNPDAKPSNKETDCANPITPYGIGKYTFENYLINSGLNFTILRLSNVYGPRQDSLGEGGVISIFCENLAKNNASTINNNGKQTRDFIYVDDVVSASLKSLKQGNKKAINISTNKETTINNIYWHLNVLSEKNIKPIRNNSLLEQYRSSLSNNIARKELNWRPKKDLKQGLKDTYQWFNK